MNRAWKSPHLVEGGGESKAEVGKVRRRRGLGFAASATTCEVFGEILAKSASVAGANHSEDGGDFAGGFAFADHREGNFCRANLSGFLCGRKQEVVERLARLGEREEQGGFLGDLSVGLHRGRCGFGARCELFIGCHRINLSFYRWGGRAELPFHASTMAAPSCGATPILPFLQNKSSRESLTLLAIHIVARARAGARTTKQLRAELWIRRIQPMEQNP